jgi:hypothetical protein
MGPMTVAVATSEPITVAIRPALPTEIRMVQSQWTGALATKWKHRAHLPGDKVGRAPSGATRRDLEERSGVQIGKPGYDDAGHRHDPYIVSHSLWLKAHMGLVDRLLKTSEVVVATLPDMPDEPIGWAVFEADDERRVLHFVHVVRAARRSLVATQLVLHTRCSSASHMTPEGRGLVRHLCGTQQA